MCLCEFGGRSEGGERGKIIRVLKCGHALCAECLEAWAVHCTKAHLNPSRFGLTRAGRVVAWTPGPKCPICCARMNCVPKEDLREAVIAALSHGGVALSTHLIYSPLSPMPATVREIHGGDEEDSEEEDGTLIPGSSVTNVRLPPRW